VLAGPDGIFMVDAQYEQIGARVLAAVRRIDSGPIRFLVNTHIHGDHTAGNATFAKQGAVLLAREELREGMARQPQPAPPAPARDPARLPMLTYGMGDPVRLRMNGETVELIPVAPRTRRRHDRPIRERRRDHDRRLLPQLRLSLHRHRQRRIVEGRAGRPRAHDEDRRPDDAAHSGHGTYINRTDIVPYRDMILDVRNRVQQLIAQGKTCRKCWRRK
jgi:hypothetical protein